jgi:gentisate 1,2-dioxygenase
VTRRDSPGKLEVQAAELPGEYADALRATHLAPLWRSIRSLIPYETPIRRTRAAHWRYADIRSLLLESGNRSERAPAFVFVIDDAPLQRKLEIYQELDH